MGDHAPLAPSFAPVWGRCSAAVSVSANAPNLASEASRVGEAAHWIVSEVLNSYIGGNGLSVCGAYVGMTAPNGVVIDEGMAEGADAHVTDVMSVVGNGHLRKMRVEHRVYMRRVHAQNWGTLDTAAYFPEEKILYIWDYKHGHRECKAAGNLQLIEYAEGMAEELGLNGHDDQVVRLVLRIVQPFAYSAGGPVDEWSGYLSDIRADINMLRSKAHEVYAVPVMTTGAHCRDCKGVMHCSARRNADYNMIDLSDAPLLLDDMGSRSLGVERAILRDGIKSAQARLDAIEDEITYRLSDGDVHTGLALEAGGGRLKWGVEPAVAEAMASQFGFSITTGAVKTPAQAKASAPREVRAIFEQAIAGVTSRPSGKMKLVNADSTVAARAFKKED